MSSDVITLTVPAKGEYARAVRMTAAALMGHSDLSYDEVDDVRMAAEEAFVYAVDTLDGDDSVTMRFTVDAAHIEMQVCLGEVGPDEGTDAEDRAELATFILEAVCDRYEFTSDADGVRTLTVEKLVGSGDAD